MSRELDAGKGGSRNGRCGARTTSKIRHHARDETFLDGKDKKNKMYNPATARTLSMHAHPIPVANAEHAIRQRIISRSSTVRPYHSGKKNRSKRVTVVEQKPLALVFTGQSLTLYSYLPTRYAHGTRKSGTGRIPNTGSTVGLGDPDTRHTTASTSDDSPWWYSLAICKKCHTYRILCVAILSIG